MLADNVLYLKKNFSDLYRVLNEHGTIGSGESLLLEDTKNNQKTIRIQKDDTSVYLHSKYDPLREANAIIDSFAEKEVIDGNTHVLFYGLGLGYHVDVFIRKFPEVSFSIYEPSPEVFDLFLGCKNLKELNYNKLELLQCEFTENEMTSFVKKLLTKVDKSTIILELPVYNSVYAEKHDRFLSVFLELVRNKRSMINTNMAFQKRWIYNSVENLKQVLNSSNILMRENNCFVNKTAILVSAGPSLNYEIENLKHIKEKGLALIFSVGSAINTLLHYGIEPDAICTYDPTVKNNELVFKTINELKINTIPLIYGSSVGYEVLLSYAGPKYHMITNQDLIADYFLMPISKKELERVHDASTIAVVTMELLTRLGFSTVILVGQNLAYLDEKNYAEGIDYNQEDSFERQMNLIKVEDVSGNEILTNESYNVMRRQIELYVKTFNMDVINTTRGGARIEGTKYLPMENVIKNLLLEKKVQGDEFREDSATLFYDPQYLNQKLLQMEKAYKNFNDRLAEIKRQIPKTKEAINSLNKNRADSTYNKMDQQLEKLETNDYFRTIAMPMNRVRYQLLIDSSQQLKNEKNQFKRYKQMLTEIDSFLDVLIVDENLNKSIIETLTSTVEEYVKKAT